MSGTPPRALESPRPSSVGPPIRRPRLTTTGRPEPPHPGCRTGAASRGLAPGFLAAALALAAPAPGARAATLPVSACGDSGQPGQLRQVISTAAPGDTIQLPGCTIVLTGPAGENANAGGDLDVAGSLTIRGLGREATVLDGGGGDRVLHVLTGAAVTLEDLTIRHGRSPPLEDGGGILNDGDLTLTRVTLTGNVAAADRDGGGIFSLELATLTATDVEVSDNEAGGDGGGLAAEGPLTLVRVRVVGNRAPSGDGGGIHALATVSIADSTIEANHARFNGGGVDLRAGATGTITRSTIWANVSDNTGGGLRIRDGVTLTLTNVTVGHNIARGDDGGGGLNVRDATAHLVNSTVARNAGLSGFAQEAGGIVKLDTGTLRLDNTVVALNVARSGSVDDNVDPAKVDPASTGSLVGGEPRLGPLQDNGGPTLTMAPFPGSPLVDAGSNAAALGAGLLTDQRGAPRIQDGDAGGGAIVDIGAVEVGPPPGGLLAISPGSGPYLAGRRLDVVLFLHAPGRTLTGAAATARLDGADVSAGLRSCLPPGVVPDGGLAVRCPSLIADGPVARETGLGPGTHTLEVTVPFADGSSARARAVWDLLAPLE